MNDIVTVTYTQPGDAALQDASGNKVAGFTVATGGPESVLVGADGVTKYVSETTAGKISAIAADGSRSVIASSLNAPKGLALMNGKLYVTATNKIVEIDLANNTASDYVGSAAFAGLVDANTVANLSLNDLATDGAGNLYVSDWEANNAIYNGGRDDQGGHFGSP